MLRRIWALTQKEIIQLLRMPIVVVGMLVGPALELILFATAIRTDVRNIPVVVADQSLSATSRRYLDAFRDSGSFDIVAAVPDEVAAIHAIDSGAASIGLVIPPDFAGRMAQKRANVLLLVDGSNSFVTQAASANAAAISQQYAISLTPQRPSPLNAYFRVLYNPDLQDLWFVVPGLGVYLLFMVTVKLTALGVVREREVGTIEALLVTPMRPIELMIAKMIPNLVLAMLITAQTYALGILIFGVPFRGSLLLFAALAALFAIGSLGIGLAISSISQTQVQANQLATLTGITVMFVSGFLFPTYGLPWILRWLGFTMPMTFFMPIVTGIITKGVGLSHLWVPVVSLAALTIVIFYLGARLFRQNLD